MKTNVLIDGFTELTPKYSSNKSYYGKATVQTIELEDDRNAIILNSYQTPVIMVITDGSVYKTKYADYSNTTRKHVYDFLRQTNHPELANLKALRDDEKIPEMFSFEDALNATKPGADIDTTY